MSIVCWWVRGGRRCTRHTDPSVTNIRHAGAHRVGGPAVMWEDGSDMWCRLGVAHRVDGPAEGVWWVWHGKQHRIEGPAEYHYWWLEGRRVPWMFWRRRGRRLRWLQRRCNPASA